MESHYTRMHQEVKKTLKCDHCSKTFYPFDKHSLEVHKHLHDNYDKKYKCSKCDKRFSHIAHLRAHTSEVHGPKDFKCPTCPRAFSKISYLKRHQ